MEKCNKCHKPIRVAVITKRGTPSTQCRRCFIRTARGNAKFSRLAAKAASEVPEGMRMCSRCHKTKPLEAFKVDDNRRRHVHSADKITRCVPCRKGDAVRAAESRALWSPEKKKKFDQEKVEYHKQQRAKMLEAYGNKCACCGETQPEFLAIDHVESDGHLHRKVIGYDTAAMYRWAKKNGFPDTLQILCHNCNMAKAFYGGCPHQKFSVLSLVPSVA